MKNSICREDVLAILRSHASTMLAAETVRAVEALPFFPAPNPESKDGRNVMGQTQEEFHTAVEAQ